MRQRYQLFIALITLAVCILLISPGASWWVRSPSVMLGGTDETDARGHVGLFILLSMTWTWMLGQRWTRKHTIIAIVVGGVVLAGASEVAQLFIPERGSSLIDFGADVLGTVIGVMLALVVQYAWARTQRIPRSPHQP